MRAARVCVWAAAAPWRSAPVLCIPPVLPVGGSWCIGGCREGVGGNLGRVGLGDSGRVGAAVIRPLRASLLNGCPNIGYQRFPCRGRDDLARRRDQCPACRSRLAWHCLAQDCEASPGARPRAGRPAKPVGQIGPLASGSRWPTFHALATAAICSAASASSPLHPLSRSSTALPRLPPLGVPGT